MDELIQKQIVYSGFEAVNTKIGTKYKIKDEKGLTYSFFEFKKDGNMTKAYEQFQKLKIGQTVEVNYKEEQSTYEGKNITFRTIMFFGEATSENAQKTQETIQQNGVNQELKEIKSMLVTILDILNNGPMEVNGTEINDALSEAAEEDQIPIDQIPF